MIMNFIEVNLERLKEESPVFETLCLPGMTEEYRLNMFLHIEPDSDLKLLYITEENSVELGAALE